jgi:hypothetical protein
LNGKLCLLFSTFALVAAALAGGASAGTISSLTGSDCGSTSLPFAQWGDSASYYLINNGGFESAGGWTLAGGAAVVSGNEPFHVNGAGDASSLRVPAGGSATSAASCFGLLNPGVRFFATGTGTVHVQVIVNGLLGQLAVLDGGSVAVGNSWAPSPKLGTTISQLNSLVGAKSIAFKLTASGGSALVDDIYVDPFLAR